MPSKFHQSLLINVINEYAEKGYKLINLDTNLTDNYRPDAVMENHDEIVIIEVVVSSDRVPKVENLQPFFTKSLRIDKRILRPKKGKTTKIIKEIIEPQESSADKILKVFEEAYPEDISIMETSRRSHFSEVTSATYVRILEAENRVEQTRMIGIAKMFKLKR